MKRVLLAALILLLISAVFLVTRTRAQTLSKHSIAYVGCSNTWDTVQAYDRYSNQSLFWSWQYYNTGGGTLDRWANLSSHYWTMYKQQLKTQGQPQDIWFQICEFAGNVPEAFSQVQTVISNLRSLSPNAVIYVSPLNSYNPSNICGITGPNGVSDATKNANLTVAAGLALAGPGAYGLPVLGPLTASTTVDGCHPNDAGLAILGPQMASFFDSLSTTSTLTKTTSTPSSTITTLSTSSTSTASTVSVPHHCSSSAWP
jgi:hypothetical protein